MKMYILVQDPIHLDLQFWQQSMASCQLGHNMWSEILR